MGWKDVSNWGESRHYDFFDDLDLNSMNWSSFDQIFNINNQKIVYRVEFKEICKCDGKLWVITELLLSIISIKYFQ